MPRAIIPSSATETDMEQICDLVVFFLTGMAIIAIAALNILYLVMAAS